MFRYRSSSRPLTAATAFLAAIALAASSWAQEAPSGDATHESHTIELPVEDGPTTTVRVEHKRVPIPSLSEDVDQPFTIEIPVSWEVRRDIPAAGLFLGPPTGDPNSHPDMLLVRESSVPLDVPGAVLTNLRHNAEVSDWSLREAETRDFGGVEGLWIVRDMPPVGFHGERVSYAVKLPLEEGSLDVLAAVPTERNAALEPAIRHMLLSIRPAAAPEPEPLD